MLLRSEFRSTVHQDMQGYVSSRVVVVNIVKQEIRYTEMVKDTIPEPVKFRIFKSCAA